MVTVDEVPKLITQFFGTTTGHKDSWIRFLSLAAKSCLNQKIPVALVGTYFEVQVVQ